VVVVVRGTSRRRAPGAAPPTPNIGAAAGSNARAGSCSTFRAPGRRLP